MPETPVPSLSFTALQSAIRGNAAAIRLVTRLEPAGGPQDKVFPPTYAGAVYAAERRRVNGSEVDAVLLDSVQSQANRLELALLQAYDDGQLKFPLMWVEFPATLVPGGRITALEAPHRIADAIFRDSTLKGLPFRPQPKAQGVKDKGKSSPEGERFASASIRNATPLFELCPSALIFGVWDSTGAAGGLGNKFARVLVSEIVGMNAVVGVRTSSRIDPLGIEKVNLYEDAEGNWTAEESRAKKEGNEPVPFRRKKADKGKPSEINHGNVTPDIVRYADNANTRDVMKREEVSFNYSVGTRDGDVSGRSFIKTEGTAVRKGEMAPGGITMTHAMQTTVLSLPGLRRLRFPDEQGKSNQERDNAARTVLAALALAAVVYQRDLQGYDLRSRCNLVPAEEQAVFEIVTTATKAVKFTLAAAEAASMFKQAVAAAMAAGLPWSQEPITLKPKPALLHLIQMSRELLEIGEEP